MADAIARALELVGRYDAEVARLLPADAEIFDAHLHLGHDIDGMVGDYDQLIELMVATASRARSCSVSTSPTGIRLPRRQRPHARLRRALGRPADPVRAARPERDAARGGERCLDAGARGIKLHPRAQRFDATDERLGPVFALAAERRVRS